MRGTLASAGRYTGPVRIVMGEAEFGKLQPGRVLVGPITLTVWVGALP